MKIFRNQDAPPRPADPATFGGAARTQRLAEDSTGVPVGVYRVEFENGGRTNWHAHSGPQWLFVVEGRIRIQVWGEASHELAEGDAVVIAPDEKHWHGASPGSRGVHLAVNVNLVTTWMEPVTDAQYLGVRR